MKRILQIGLFVVAAVGAAMAQGADVAKRMVTLDARDSTCPEIISMLAMMNKIPTGFQQRAGAAEAELERKRNVSFPRPLPLPILMNAVTSECSGYAWSGGSVLNVFPTPKEDSVLDVTLSKFEAANITAEAALERIFESPEVKRYLKEKKLSRSTAHQGLSSADSNAAKLSLTAANRSVRDILNQIVATSSQKIWVYQGPAGKSTEINLRVF